ncbi:hypothetical protein PHYSODRAFT_257369 [Phytophthora sojae]|uniref:Uncharacterized protein n=1 Tax=Phytophthora sojae (strain P6497) TaxID=1094619 RepID=G4YJX7_PHYSP|nr:hypothetical protein PHYSODRAFT_257369 [Phytophthora sojae]EGZ27109.1 hypothetical protein PHYSODRAFT_257369 [Phytophthora sojae]|eukprot:XP_009514384.1 hypothetical protein PHYSODRAFT_257369 [Phytophthora sojae]
MEAERRAQEEAERRSREAEWYPEVPAYSGPVEPVDYATVHEDHLLRARPDVAEVATELAKQQYEADREDLETRWKERLNAAEAKLQRAYAERASAEAERSHRADEADGEMKKRLDSVQQTIQNVLLERERERAERELERDTTLNRQKFLADQNRELRATLSQNTTEVGAAQLRATVGTSLPKKETAGSSQGTKTVPTSKSSASKSESAAKGSASSAAKKSVAKKSASRRSSSRRGTKEDAGPPSSDPDDSDSSSSDSSDDDSSSSDYSSSSSDDFDLDLTTSTTTKEGTTVWTYRPYINYNAVEKFSEDASVNERVGWWDRFIDMAAQGSWPDKVKIRQLRGRMSSSLRDWHNWKKLSRRFKVMYCRTTGSYSELYYTMKGQKFKSISEVEHALRRHEDIWREEGYDTPRHDVTSALTTTRNAVSRLESLGALLSLKAQNLIQTPSLNGVSSLKSRMLKSSRPLKWRSPRDERRVQPGSAFKANVTAFKQLAVAEDLRELWKDWTLEGELQGRPDL